MKLLIVEDDDKLRTELARFFSGHGYETEEITDYEIWKRRSESRRRSASFRYRSSFNRWDVSLPQSEKKVITSYCDHYQPEYGNERTAVYELRSR